MLAYKRFAVLEDLVLGVEQAETVRIHASSLLSELVLDILNGCLVCDLDTGRESLDWFLRSYSCPC
jgi:hypothetical protein